MKKIRTLVGDMWGVVRTSHEPEHMRLIADTYWRALISFGVLAILFAAIFGAIESAYVASVVETASEATKSPRIDLDRAKLDATIARFFARAERYHALSATPIATPDPSQ